MTKASKILSDIIVYSKYAMHLPDLARRETWSELTDRNMQMYMDRYPKLTDHVFKAFSMVHDKKVLPSMRALQFGGAAILKNNSRVYNCSFVAIDDHRAFSEAMFLLLSGTGVGYSVQRRHVSQLPPIQEPARKRRFLISDSIEGWADSIKALMKAYLFGKSLPDFVFDDIRPKGTLLSSGGKAPGPEPLRIALEKIHSILRSKAPGERLTPLNCHDIMCHLADAVLAGGIRRAACNCLFDHDDEQMLSCKSGEWWELNPQRGRANNSAVLVRGVNTEEDFWRVWRYAQASGAGEPGVFWSNDPDIGTNPCVPASETVLTSEGVKTVGELVGRKVRVVVDGEEHDTTDEGFVLTGYKPVFRVRTSEGFSFRATGNHLVLTTDVKSPEKGDVWKAVEDLQPGDMAVLHDHTGYEWGGQGTFEEGRLDGSLMHLREAAELSGFAPKNPYGKPVQETGTSSEYYRGALQGWFSARGGIYQTTSGQLYISLPSHKPAHLEMVQRMLLRLGIHAQVFKAKKGLVVPPNGLLEDAWAMTLKISGADLDLYQQAIGLGEWEKDERLAALMAERDRAPVVRPYASKVESVEPDGEEAVYDCTVPGIEAFDASGFFVHNCFEISLHSQQFCVAADTPLITRTGLVEIGEAVGEEIEVWNGERWSAVRPFKTGENQKLLRVRFGDGSYLDCTEYHRFSVKNRFEKTYREVQAKDLAKERYTVSTEDFQIDNAGGSDEPLAYTIGVAYGDGCRDKVTLYGEAKMALPIVGTRYNSRYRQNPDVPQQDVRLSFDGDGFDIGEAFRWNRKSALAFVAGLADTDGSETPSGGIRIYQADEGFCRKLQLLLLKNGIRSSVNLMAGEGSATNFGPRKKAMWYVQVTDCADIPCNRLDTSHGHKPRWKGKSQTIASIEELPGLHDTYCFTEKERHMGVFGTCLTYQCNLTEINGSDVESQEDLEQRAWAASIIGTLQASLTDFHYLRPEWRRMTEEEALLGVSLTGQASRAIDSLDLVAAARRAVAANRDFAPMLGINTSARVTTVKPSGTASSVLGCSSGIHAWYSPYYVRRIRVGKNEPIYSYIAAFFPELVEDEFFNPKNMAVISLPIEAPQGSLFREDEGAIDMLERVKRVFDSWILPGHVSGRNTHNISATVFLKDDEWTSVGEWMWENREHYNGLACLPYDGGSYKQMPFEEISKERYDEMANAIHEGFDITQIREDGDYVDFLAEAACAGGACEIASISK